MMPSEGQHPAEASMDDGLMPRGVRPDSLIDDGLMRGGLRPDSTVAAQTVDGAFHESGRTSALIGMPTTAHPLAVSGRLDCDVPLCSRDLACSGNLCCNTQMFEAASEITKWMSAKGIEHVLLFGSLLGAHRDHDVIPWTNDVDIGVYSKDVPAITAQKDIPWSFAYDGGIGRGCESHHPGFTGEFEHITSWDHAAPRSYYIDLYVLDQPEHGGDIAKPCVSPSVDGNGQLQTTFVDIRGTKFKAPLHIEQCLEGTYGQDWRIPDPEHHGGW